MSARRLVVLLAAVLLGTVVPVSGAAPATAASGYCAKGSGVSVVVDRGALGGGTSVGCDPKGANTSGSTVVPRAGFPLTYVQQQPGFVCRVSGVPASAGCGSTPPADAYWGLFWSDGKSGHWTYASTGVGSLKVPAGGFIGWKWQNSSTRTTPGTSPISPVAPKPKPKPKPAPKPSPKPSPKPAPKPSPRPVTSSGGSSPVTPSHASGPAGSAGSSTPAAAHRNAVATKVAAKKAVAKKQAVRKKKAAARAKRVAASASASASESAATTGQDGSSSSPAASPRTHLTSGEQTPGSGSGPMLPLLAAGIVVLLLGAAGRLVWVRRRG